VTDRAEALTIEAAQAPIRIVQVSGMPGGVAGTAGGAVAAAGATFPEQVMNSALQYQVAKPLVDAVMKDAGLSNEGITGMAHALSGMLGRTSAEPGTPVSVSSETPAVPH